MYKKLTEEEERIGRAIVETAIELHRVLGPGLLEKVYEVCFVHLLRKKGFTVVRQVDVPITYDGIVFDEGLRLDVLVNDLVICELKARELINEVWPSQVLSHLRLTNRRLGYLLNFRKKLMKDGIERIIN